MSDADASLGRVVAISGAGTGIGQAAARKFAALGWGWRQVAGACSASRRRSR
jgi:NAD(P)-dependent dehydrogenase (short-subunit alcohol dehydrogenase family)